ARVFNQLVGVLGGDAIRGIFEGAGGTPGIIAIFLAEALIDASGGVADHPGDVGEGLRGPLEALVYEPTRAFSSLTRQLIAAFAEAVGEATVAVLAPRSGSAGRGQVAIFGVARIVDQRGAFDYSVSAVGQIGSRFISPLVRHGGQSS